MRDTLRGEEEPRLEVVHRGRPRLRATHLAKFSGIPHVQKLKVDAESLVHLMIGLQLNIEEERRLVEETEILYDPHYLSGLVALPSPKPSLQERDAPKWPLISSKGRKHRKLKTLEKVVEEREMQAPLNHIVSTELLYEAPIVLEEQVSPKQVVEITFPASNFKEHGQIGQSWENMTNSFPSVPTSHDSMPDMTDGSSTSVTPECSEGTTSHVSKSQIGVTLQGRRRVQSESSIDTHQSQSQSIHKPSLHMHSPWLEELIDSFDIETNHLFDNVLGARGPLDAQRLEYYGKPLNWGNTPLTTRNQSLASQMDSLCRYRTTRISSATT